MTTHARPKGSGVLHLMDGQMTSPGKVGEIEITPEMIEAGTAPFWALPEFLGPSSKGLEDTVVASFIAMLSVHRERAHGSNVNLIIPDG